MTMNARIRYLSTMSFEPVDRVPLSPGGGRKATRERWRREGLPAEIPDHGISEFAYRQAGGTLPWPSLGEKCFSVDERMRPQFEEKVIQRGAESQVVQDWKGNICEIGNEFTVEYLRNAIDFVTRRWIKCPVENRSDWEDMKQRYDAEDKGRLPDNPEELGIQLKEREHLVGLHFSGPFWQLREWVGFENLCMMFYDDPELLREMLHFWQEYIARLLTRSLVHFIPDYVHISEDMAYKGFSMISPGMAREFLLPVWVRWGEIIRNAGVPLYMIDSDGYIGELIPLWLEAGMNACDPIEVAAGNDIVQVRQKFGRDMAYSGGVDKRAIAAGGTAIEKEIERITPVIRGGGYIPACDHGVPHDVSWPDFVRYTGLLAKATGWL